MKKQIMLFTLAALLTGCGGSTSSTTSATLQPKLGTYGSSNDPVTLELTSSGGTLDISCGGDVLTQPLTVDASGHFDVPADQHIGLPSPSPVPIHLIGSVRGNTITILQKNDVSGTTGITYTLVYGQQSPPFDGPCPG